MGWWGGHFCLSSQGRCLWGGDIHPRCKWQEGANQVTVTRRTFQGKGTEVQSAKKGGDVTGRFRSCQEASMAPDGRWTVGSGRRKAQGHGGSDKPEDQWRQGRDYTTLGPKVLLSEGLVCENRLQRRFWSNLFPPDPEGWRWRSYHMLPCQMVSMAASVCLRQKETLGENWALLSVQRRHKPSLKVGNDRT